MHKKTLLVCLALSLALSALETRVGAQDKVQEAAQSKAKSDSRIHLARARVYAGDDRLDSAVTELRKAIEADPIDTESLAFLALLQGRRGDYLASVANIKKAVRIKPQNASYYSILGRGLAATGDVQGARAAFNRSIALDNKNATSYANLAAVEGQMGRYREAAFLYKKAIAHNPHYEEAYLGLSLANGKLDDQAGQLEAARKAVEVAPKSARAHARLGYLLSLHKDMTGAMSEGLKSNLLRIQDSWNDFLGMFLTAWACVFFAFAAIFAAMFAGSNFKPQENEKVIRSFFLTFYKDKPGRFVITDGRIVFVPEAFSAWFGATRVSIQRSQIESISLVDTVGGGTVSILTKDQSVHQFRMPVLVLEPLKELLLSQHLIEAAQ